MAVEMMVAVVVIAVKAALTRAADLKDYIFTQPKKKKTRFCSEYLVVCNFIYFYIMHFFKFYINTLYS